ncbi:hypothetical protein [Streptomyces rishiriensis]|uniref:hypothetical protein n=1 Tax=Streptomyces rishiriensis TaxID=68264 RepID=UPI000D59475C|nr:hypothetical protein [Streptomyces rishiriensis]
MRSARMILATAAATAALAVGAPGAHAADGGRDHDGSSHSREDHSSTGKGDDAWAGKHDKEDHDAPHGGMHTGGGALTALGQGGDRDGSAAKDPRFDPETYKDQDWQKEQDGGGEHGQEDHGRQDASAGQDDNSWNGGHQEDADGWKGEHDKPNGGMHTGGGALAGPSLTAGGLGILAVAGTGLYALRRKKTAASEV